MRKLFLTIFLLTTISIAGFAQSFDTAARVQAFIKTWGFLKYYHPAVAAGQLDWDSVLLANVSAVMNVQNKTQFNQTIKAVLDVAGNLTKKAKPNFSGELFLKNKTSTNWISNSKLFSGDVKSRLQYVYEASSVDSNKYIKIVYQTADFGGEKKYDDLSFPDVKYRLLFLSRFWNIINYFAPYKYLTTDWDAVLKNFIPKFIRSNDTPSYYQALAELSKSLNDGHSQLASNGQMQSDLFFGKYTAPFYCQIVEGKVVIRNVGSDSVANAFNIRQGDVVIKLDGEDIAKVIARRRRYISASNQASEDHLLSRYILDGQSSKAQVELERDNHVIKTTVMRVSTQKRDWSPFINYTHNEVGYKQLPDSVLLVYAMQIWNGNVDTIKQMVKRSKAVIFDVRNYPSNDAFFLMPDAFLPEPKTIDYSTVAVPQYPGLFQWHLNQNKIGHSSDSAFKGRVVILCDERTQSQGEYSCMVLQTIPGAVTIGSQTAGADGIVTNIPMGNGLTISYSGYGVYYPDKRQTQRVGVKIDIPVTKTLKAIKENRDEILERALKYLKNGK